MQFFKPELWEKINSDVEDERVKAELEWENNSKIYTETFNNLKNRLPEEFLSIYLKNSGFHDYAIKSVEIKKIKKCEVDTIAVNLEILNKHNSWIISYSDVNKITFSYNTEDDSLSPLTSLSGGFEEWGYDEFSSIDDQRLSHEILFASGSSLWIYFGNISVLSLN